MEEERKEAIKVAAECERKEKAAAKAQAKLATEALKADKAAARAMKVSEREANEADAVAQAEAVEVASWRVWVVARRRSSPLRLSSRTRYIPFPNLLPFSPPPRPFPLTLRP